MTTEAMITAVRAAWSTVPAPPAEDLRYMAWGWGEAAEHAFLNVAPMDVDITSPGFLGCTPLLDLPTGAAAAYLGTYIVSLLHGLRLQEGTGLFHDIVTRAHLITCLIQPDFWRAVIRPSLPLQCRNALIEFAAYLASRRDLIILREEEVDLIASLATECHTWNT